MILFQHQGYTFEEHGPECDCVSCRKTEWPADIKAVVLMKTKEHGYYQISKNREEAADRILRRWLR